MLAFKNVFVQFIICLTLFCKTTLFSYFIVLICSFLLRRATWVAVAQVASSNVCMLLIQVGKPTSVEGKTTDKKLFSHNSAAYNWLLLLPVPLTPPDLFPSCFPLLLFSLSHPLSLSSLVLSGCSLSQQVDRELLTGLIQM